MYRGFMVTVTVYGSVIDSVSCSVTV
jgi:hypothetical protein